MGIETDSAVIAASIEDPERFGILFDRYAPVVFRYLVRRVGVDEADPLLGEVFRVAFERRSTYDSSGWRPARGCTGSPPICWPIIAAVRPDGCGRWAASSAVGCHPTTERGHRGCGRRAKLWPEVAHAITLLPDTERDALVLYVWEELSYDQIAVALGVPIGTVRSRLNRARVRLRELDRPSGRQR